MSQFGGRFNASLTLWKHCGVKVVAGAVLGAAERDGVKPLGNYDTFALV
jgi:hypothetical protein